MSWVYKKVIHVFLIHSPIRQGPSGPAFRTRAAGALGTTGHNISQYQNQVHQEGQQNENQV